MITRRKFLLASLPAAALLAGARALAQPARLEESDTLAVNLGYRHDASKVDPKRFPSYVAGHNCANCQLFQAKGKEEWAPCAAVGGKLVNAKGWCVAWVKKS